MNKVMDIAGNEIEIPPQIPNDALEIVKIKECIECKSTTNKFKNCGGKKCIKCYNKKNNEKLKEKNYYKEYYKTHEGLERKIKREEKEKKKNEEVV